MAIRLPRTQIAVWLFGIVQKIAAQARIHSIGKSGTAQGKIKISARLSGRNKATVTARDFHTGRLPFDSTLDVPIGGFTPPSGKRAFRMIKPEGRVVYRSRIYTKFSGQKITRKGFLSEAARDVMAGSRGRGNVLRFAKLLVNHLVHEVADELVAKMLANGIMAVKLTFGRA